MNNLQPNPESLSVVVHHQMENLPCLHKAIENFTGQKKNNILDLNVQQLTIA